MSKAEKLIDRYLEFIAVSENKSEKHIPFAAKIVEEQINEQLLDLIWKKLNTKVKARIDKTKLSTFIQGIEGGKTLVKLAAALKISNAFAAELLTAIEKTGLI